MNPIAARMDFEQAVDMFIGDSGLSRQQAIQQFKLTQSEIRLEQPLVANNNTYNFPVPDNIPSPNIAGGSFNTELRLRMQDTFVPTAIFVGLAKPASAVDTAFRLHSYPNQSVFASAIQMRALYNGSLQLQVNNYQYLYKWGLQRHWFSPQTQQTAAFAAGQPEDEMNGAADGFFPMQPFIMLNGAQAFSLQIVLAAPPTAVDANSRYVIRMLGVNAQNSTGYGA